MTEHDVSQVVHSAAHGSGHAAPHELPNWITLLHNHFPDAAWVQFLHQWENVFFSLSAAALISFVALSASKNWQMIPGGLQNFFEAIVEGVESFVTGILGEAGRKHVPYLGTVFIYILLMNWSGLIPLMKSPTAAWSTTIALALTTMVYIQWTGIREQGLLHYLKHLAGNPSNLIGWFMVILMLPLNIILELGAVPFSLSLRLFANISSEDRLLYQFASLPLARPFLPFFFDFFANCLAIIFSLVQAFVFTLLTTVYLSLVMPHEDHEHAEVHPETAH